MVKICFICKSHHVFIEHLSIAKYLKRKGYDPFFIFADEYYEDVAQILKHEKIRFYRHSRNVFIENNNNEALNGNLNYFGIVKKLISRILPYRIKETISITKNMLRYKKVINNIFFKDNPNCLILYPDRSLGYNIPSAIIAKKNNIPVVTIQLGSQNVRFLAKFRMNKKMSGNKYLPTNLFNYLTTKLFPGNVLSIDQQNVLFFPWHVIITLFFLKMLPKNPWFLGQSFSDKYLMISKQYLLDDINDGLKQENVQVVGQLALDDIFINHKKADQIRKKILLKYFDEYHDGRSIVIVGLPQFYEHNYLGLNESKDEIKYIINAIDHNKNKTIFLSMHPKMSFANYDDLNSINNRTRLFEQEQLKDVLPIADYYYCFNESTLVWAILCKVIPVYLDYYDNNITIENYGGAIQTLSDKKNIKQDILRIEKDKQDIIDLMSVKNKNLPPFDGKSGKRIEKEINQVCMF